MSGVQWQNLTYVQIPTRFLSEKLLHAHISSDRHKSHTVQSSLLIWDGPLTLKAYTARGIECNQGWSGGSVLCLRNTKRHRVSHVWRKASESIAWMRHCRHRSDRKEYWHIEALRQASDASELLQSIYVLEVDSSPPEFKPNFQSIAALHNHQNLPQSQNALQGIWSPKMTLHTHGLQFGMFLRIFTAVRPV